MTAVRVIEASGSNGEVQFASGSGIFGADARFKFDADAVRLGPHQLLSRSFPLLP